MMCCKAVATVFGRCHWRSIFVISLISCSFTILIYTHTCVKTKLTHYMVQNVTPTDMYVKPTDGLNKPIDGLNKTAWYFKSREHRVTRLNHTFLTLSKQVCTKDEAPFLIIISLTQEQDLEERELIRNTWGSVFKQVNWPRTTETFQNMKFVFIYGISETNNASQQIKDKLHREKETHGDIIHVNISDKYTKLTTKVLMALKWVDTYCPNTRFILKTDQDAFIHIPNLIYFLKKANVSDDADIYGTMFSRSRRNNAGKWSVNKTDYPFLRYPPYTSGTAYVISGNIIKRLLVAAEYMPLVPIEDAFITGILRLTIGARLANVKGFPIRKDPAPRDCSFHNTIHMIGTNIDVIRKQELWNQLQYPTLKDCYEPFMFNYTDVPLDKLLTERDIS